MQRSLHSLILGLAVAAFFGALGLAAADPASKKKSTLRLQSTSFKDGQMIPDQHTCKGKDISPELYWKGPPAGTQSFAILCEDPDAPLQNWVHWVIFNIPMKMDTGKNVYELAEGFPKVEKTMQGIVQGANDFSKIGYDGPCPKNGSHRYYFKLYALDSFLNLKAGISRAQFLKAIEGHVLAWTQIMGLYGQ